MVLKKWRNIIMIIAVFTISILSIYLIINCIDNKYQSTIAVATVTTAIQLVLFFLKQEFDSDSHKKPKTFGVVYDKKFIIYNDIYNQIFLSKRDIIPYLKRKLDDEEDLERAYNSMSELKKLCILSRLFMSEELYNLLKKLNERLYVAYENRSNINIYEKILPSHKLEILVKNNIIDLEYFSKDEPFFSDIQKIEKLMKKELYIE